MNDATSANAATDGDLRFLGIVDVFQVLDPDELSELHGRSHLRDVAPGTAVVTEGAAGDSLYIVKSGFLRVDQGGIEVGSLSPGDFFGEMSLLTGAPRSATVKAAEPTMVFEITKADLMPLLQRHPQLAQRMGQALSERQGANLKKTMDWQGGFSGDLGATFETTDAAPVADEGPGLASALAGRIRGFFGLPASIWKRATSAGEALSTVTGAFAGAKADTSDRQIAFTTAIVLLAAKMAASAGSYGGAEIDVLSDSFAIAPEDVEGVRRLYDGALGSAKGYEPYANRIHELFDGDQAVMEELVGVLLRVADAPGGDQAKKRAFVATVAGLFGFDASGFERLETIHERAAAGFDGADDMDYLTILGLTADADEATAKKTYRRLVVDNHPDKLIARGVPAEFVEQANEKLATINLAYDRFRQARGLA